MRRLRVPRTRFGLFIGALACGVAAAGAQQPASYRARLLGVFDAPTGAPVEGAHTIYLDGIRVADTNLLAFPVNELGAVEAYSATTAPAQYTDPSKRCGVLLLWSRER